MLGTRSGHPQGGSPSGGPQQPAFTQASYTRGEPTGRVQRTCWAYAWDPGIQAGAVPARPVTASPVPAEATHACGLGLLQSTCVILNPSTALARCGCQGERPPPPRHTGKSRFCRIARSCSRMLCASPCPAALLHTSKVDGWFAHTCETITKVVNTRTHSPALPPAPCHCPSPGTWWPAPCHCPPTRVPGTPCTESPAGTPVGGRPVRLGMAPAWPPRCRESAVPHAGRLRRHLPGVDAPCLQPPGTDAGLVPASGRCRERLCTRLCSRANTQELPAEPPACACPPQRPAVPALRLLPGWRSGARSRLAGVLVRSFLMDDDTFHGLLCHGKNLAVHFL